MTIPPRRANDLPCYLSLIGFKQRDNQKMTYDTINDAQTIAGSGEGTLLAGRYRVA